MSPTDTLNQAPSLQIDGRVATIELRRPRLANRLAPEDLFQLQRHIKEVDESDVLVLRLRASGTYFCSGFDLTRLAGLEEMSVVESVVNAVEDCRPVTIASLNGGVYGGAADLAVACDFRIGAANTEMSIPAARLGLHFYKRGMERLVSRLGLDMAKRLLLTATRLDAIEMKRCGFLTDLVDADQLDARVEELTAVLVSMAPLAVLGMKKHLNAAAQNAINDAAVRVDLARACGSADFAEGRLAWMEKRAPAFCGR